MPLSGAFFVTEGSDYDPDCIKDIPTECLNTFYNKLCQDEFASVYIGDCCENILAITSNCYGAVLVEQARKIHLCDDKPIDLRGDKIRDNCYGLCDINKGCDILKA